MKSRESAILLGIGTARRKFEVTNNNPVGLFVKVPAREYLAKASGKLCKGNGNHKCLFNKGDTLNVLCPETVMEDGQATVFVHRECNGKYMLMQRNFHDYKDRLEFKEERVLEFPVKKVGYMVYGGYDEFLCVQPVQGTNLWIDKRLILSCELRDAKGSVVSACTQEQNLGIITQVEKEDPGTQGPGVNLSIVKSEENEKPESRAAAEDDDDDELGLNKDGCEMWGYEYNIPLFPGDGDDFV